MHGQSHAPGGDRSNNMYIAVVLSRKLRGTTVREERKNVSICEEHNQTCSLYCALKAQTLHRENLAPSPSVAMYLHNTTGSRP